MCLGNVLGKEAGLEPDAQCNQWHFSSTWPCCTKLPHPEHRALGYFYLVIFLIWEWLYRQGEKLDFYLGLTNFSLLLPRQDLTQLRLALNS